MPGVKPLFVSAPVKAQAAVRVTIRRTATREIAAFFGFFTIISTLSRIFRRLPVIVVAALSRSPARRFGETSPTSVSP